MFCASRQLLLVTVLVVVVDFTRAKTNPASSALTPYYNNHQHLGGKTSGKVFGIFERNGRQAEKFEVPASSIVQATGGIHLPLQITSAQGSTSLKKGALSHKMASFLTLLVFGTVSHVLFFQGETPIAFVAIAIVLYWIEAMTCSTRRYLSNALTPRKVENYLKSIELTPPTIIWTMECYHYRRVDHHYGSARNHEKRQDSVERVVTQRVSQQYIFQSWKDDTDTSMIERLLFSDQETSNPAAAAKAFSKITLSKMLLFANGASYYDYVDQESKFRTDWQHRDTHYDFQIKLQIEGLLPKILAAHYGLAGPGLAKSIWFYLFTLFGLTVPYRIWFSRHCRDLEVTITKEVTGSIF